MSEWRKVRVDEIAEKIAIGPFGSRMKSDTYTEIGVPVIRGTNLTGGRNFSGEWVYISEEDADQLASCNVTEGDLVFPHRGAIGEVGIVPGDRDRYLLSSSLMKLKCDPKKAHSLYLFYFFKSHEGRHQLLKNASQVGTPGIGQPLSSLKSIELELPPLSNQRAIANILGTLDDKIELNRRMNETLEAIARTVFKSWFVDFDPVRAKMSGEPPESICQRLGLTPDLLALFPGRLVDSELGDGSTSLTTGIPEGWRVGTIGDHCYLNAKSWTAKTIPEEVYYVDLANVKNGIISEVQAFSSESAPSRARRILRAGDTIVGTVRPGNRSFALIGEDEPQLTGSTGFAVLSPKRKALREMVFFLATSDENIDRLSRLADGAAYPAVRPEVVTAGVCIVPDPQVIDAFHAATASMIDYQIANRISNDMLGAVRDTLLPKLLSGELRVPDGEKLMGAVA